MGCRFGCQRATGSPQTQESRAGWLPTLVCSWWWHSGAMGLLHVPTASRAPGKGQGCGPAGDSGQRLLPFIMGKNLLKCLIRD